MDLPSSAKTNTVPRKVEGKASRQLVGGMLKNLKNKLRSLDGGHYIGHTSTHGRAARAPASLRNRKILVIEDDYLIAEEAAERLRTAGSVVVGPASSLAEALRHAFP